MTLKIIKKDKMIKNLKKIEKIIFEKKILNLKKNVTIKYSDFFCYKFLRPILIKNFKKKSSY